MKPIKTYTVIPTLPVGLERLKDVVYNLRWAWDHEAIELFRWDDNLWEESGHNPALMLGTIDQATLEAAAADQGFLSHMERVTNDLERYLKSESTWFASKYKGVEAPLVAYFSAEFGLSDCLSIFAGGLGILAGDHLKSASDLGVPLVGVGLLYQQGYFRQYLTVAGWQQESYDNNDFYNLPLIRELDEAGQPLWIEVPYPGRMVRAHIWRAQVGRVRLYLLDTNVPENKHPDQDITDRLYGGDTEMRIQQEIMLGMGGFRALETLGFSPRVYHLNEGHSAFLALERIRRLMEIEKLSFDEAREAVSAGLVFTTHTPVPAGHDYFQPEMMKKYFTEVASSLGLSMSDFLALGRANPHDEKEPFCMTVLALRMAQSSNGVSRLHGEVTREMWRQLWPDVPVSEIPIRHVTNGVHFASWISLEMAELYDRYLGKNWRDKPGREAAWLRVNRISAEELWRTHERRRERLVAFARRRIREQLMRKGAPPSEIESADEVLDPDILTIGFARRFAGYKRANLILRDPERLARILNDPERPVQVVFSGRAHPQDDAGKELIQQIVALSRRPEFRRRLVFIEGYDMAVARSMVQGCDVWLSTPRRPLEASGTSGMKAAANGLLNLSTLDGWWDEAWNELRDLDGDSIPESVLTGHAIGWTIGNGETYQDLDYQDEIESQALYDLLERDVVPTFYERGVDKLPRHWISRMKSSIATLCHYFNTHRMVQQYTEDYYLPAAERVRALTGDDMAGARELTAWKARINKYWKGVRIESVDAGDLERLNVGASYPVKATIRLGPLTPEDVLVELYSGRIDPTGAIVDPETTPLNAVGDGRDGVYTFTANSVACCRSGLHGFTVRAMPYHADTSDPVLSGLIVWAG